MMEWVYRAIEALAPYVFFVIFLAVLVHLVKGAKMRRAGAVALAVLVHMFSPDPEFEKKAKIVMLVKESKGQQQKRDDKLSRHISKD